MPSDRSKRASSSHPRRVELFDELSLKAISYLELHPGVADIVMRGPIPATSAQIDGWEAKHQPYRLPADFKAFLEISNGLYVKWSARLRGRGIPFASMHLNGLSELEEVAEVPRGGHQAGEVRAML